MTESDLEEGRSRDVAYLDPYRPLTPLSAVPSTGSDEPGETDLTPAEEPVATGTLFLMIVFLMLTFGIWIVVYGMLLDR